jgi:hypothetical protein
MPKAKNDDTHIVSKLGRIQAALNAPKNQRNNFGKYNYRSCEDILEALKPLMEKEGCALTIRDEIVEVAGRVYVNATAMLKDKTDSVSSEAYAREPLSKKGMDESQITGATSSYARKYALNGLFAIDDCKDADTMDNRAGVPDDRGDDPEPEPVIEHASDYDMRMKLIGDWRKSQEPPIKGGDVLYAIKQHFGKHPDQMNNQELEAILPFLVEHFHREATQE